MDQKETKTCALCGKKLNLLNTSLLKREGGRICSSCAFKTIKEEKNATPKNIKEIKATCNACGKVWHYGKQDSWNQTASALSNAGKSMMCCTGCVPAIFIKDKKVTDLKKCPACGSRNVKTEEVNYEVNK